MKTQTYVLGLMFSSDLSQVLLIRKAKPTWQAGRLNGLGGKVESGESNWSAMRREFKEETGLQTKVNDWSHFARMIGPDFAVDCFAAVGDVAAARSVEAEPLEVWSVELIAGQMPQMCDGILWLVPMALDHLRDGQPAVAEVRYSEWPVKARQSTPKTP